MVWLPIGRREGDSNPPADLLTLPISVITDCICAYLNVVEITRLASLCRSLRTTLKSELRSDHYLIGDTLFARAALASGVPHHLQNRFLVSRIDCGSEFSKSLCGELEERSLKDEGSCVRWKKPFQLDESLLQSATPPIQCPLKYKLSQLIQSLPPTELSPNLRGVLEICRCTSPHHSIRRDAVFQYLSSDDHVSLTDVAADEIARDIDRTLPSHTLFQAPLEEEIKSTLYSILKGIAVMEPGIGYCQGMNFVAAGLLAGTTCATSSLWTLLYFLRHSCFSAIFSSGASALRIRLVQLDKLCKMYLPEVHHALSRVGLQTDIVGHQCFVTLFAYFLHPTLLIGLWNCILVGGVPSLLALTLALIAELGTVLTPDVDTAEAALRATQAFRVDLSQRQLDSPEGAETLRRLVNRFSEFLLVITTENLNRIASDYLLRTLVGTVKGLDFMRMSSSDGSSSPNSGSRRVYPSNNNGGESRCNKEGDGRCGIRPPYLLAPRLSTSRRKLNLEVDDVRALVVNFITEEKASCFELVPILQTQTHKSQSAEFEDETQSLRVRKRAVTFAAPESPPWRHTEEDPTKVSWSLLAPAKQQETLSSTRGITFRGKGSLSLNTFSILIDLRCYFDNTRESSQDDHIMPLFDPEQKGESKDSVADDWSVLDLATFIMTRTKKNKHSVIETRQADTRTRQNAKEASALVNWLHQHDLSDKTKAALCGRRKLNGGYLIIPLKCLCACKNHMDRRDQQLAEDRANFEDRIGHLARRVDSKLHELVRLKEKRASLLRDSDSLDTEKLHLLNALEIAESRGVRTLNGQSVWQKLSARFGWSSNGIDDELTSSPEHCKSARRQSDNAKLDQIARPMTEPRQQPPDEPDAWATSPSPSPSISPTHSPPPAWSDWVKVSFPQENEAEGNVKPEINIARISKRIRQIDRSYVKLRHRLKETSQFAALTQEALKDATEAKAILSASYHDLAQAQEKDDLRIVRESLKSNGAWTNEPLPVALLRTVGLMPTDGPMSGGDLSLSSDPSLFTDLIALPPLQMQLRTLFGAASVAGGSNA